MSYKDIVEMLIKFIHLMGNNYKLITVDDCSNFIIEKYGNMVITITYINKNGGVFKVGNLIDVNPAKEWTADELKKMWIKYAKTEIKLHKADIILLEEGLKEFEVYEDVFRLRVA